jgi:hypothetical protein
MIPDKVKALFQFIDFLDNNRTEHVEKYAPLYNGVMVLRQQQKALKPNDNYRDKLAYDEIQKTVDEKATIVKENVFNPINNKLIELKIWDGEGTCKFIWNNNTSAVRKLQETFTKPDIKKIQEHKRKYFSYRTETKNNLHDKSLLFDTLDELLKILFDFFKDEDVNEFETFETKTSHPKTVSEFHDQLKKGERIFCLPTDQLYRSIAWQNNDKDFTPQQTGTSAEEDVRFDLSPFLDSREEPKHYEPARKQIEEKGFVDIEDSGVVVAKIYTAELALILFTKKIVADNLDTKTETNINGFDYLETYIAGFEEGRNYFKEKFSVEQSILYTPGIMAYVKDIKEKYFHSGYNSKGWSYVKGEFPFILTHSAVKEFGYYSGMVSEVDDMVSTYPNAFDGFSDNIPKKSIDLKQIKNNFDNIAIETVYNHFKTGLVDRKYLTEENLLAYLKAAFDRKHVPKNRFTLSGTKSKQKVHNVFAEYYKTIAGKPMGKQKEYAGLLGNYFTGYKTATVSSNFSR